MMNPRHSEYKNLSQLLLVRKWTICPFEDTRKKPIRLLVSVSDMSEVAFHVYDNCNSVFLLLFPKMKKRFCRKNVE